MPPAPGRRPGARPAPGPARARGFRRHIPYRPFVAGYRDWLLIAGVRTC